MKKFSKKIVVYVLVIAFVFSPILATPVQAQWIDISQAAKEYRLDSIGWMIANTIVQRITASTVNWINSGFNGKPAYVTDPEAYFQDMGDKIAGQYIFSNPNLNFLCGPISAKIRLALTSNYLQEKQWQCTLTQVGKNMDDFMNNFENGGWDNFFELTQRQQNNPIGAYLQAENMINQKISSKVNTKLNELNQGKGFMSYEKCEVWGDMPPPPPAGQSPGQVALVSLPLQILSQQYPETGGVYQEHL